MLVKDLKGANEDSVILQDTSLYSQGAARLSTVTTALLLNVKSIVKFWVP
jgi:hypothetical protein